MPTETWTTVGSHSWTVPPNVAQVTIRCWGASGLEPDGSDEGELGGKAVATLPVSPGDTLYPYVGGEGSRPDGGFNGGGDGGVGGETNGCGGGGASDVRQNGETLSDRIIVAGGGGGSESEFSGADGGNGGGANQAGQDGSFGNGGGGADLTSGGSGGGSGDTAGADGSLGVGGTGGDSSGAAGGGGGGGLYGGGGGGGSTSDGGGGGSGWVADAGTDISGTTGVREGDGRIEIEYVLGPPPNPSATAAGDDITVTWDDPFDTEDGFEIYRSTSAGVDTSGTPYATVSANTTSYTDTALLDGERYYYRICAVQNGEQGNDSDEVSATTVLPAPTNLAVSNVTTDGAGLAWNNNHDNGSVTVQYRPTGASSWQDAETGLSRSTESYTLSGLRNGEQYDARVLAVTEHTQTEDA